MGFVIFPAYDTWIFRTGTRFRAPKGHHGLSLGSQPQETSTPIRALLRSLAAFSEKGKNLRLIIEAGSIVDVNQRPEETNR
jgi:hypothetical protein